jgi:enolase
MTDPEPEPECESNAKALTTEYLSKFDIVRIFNESLNELMETRPVDVCGVLSTFMLRLAQPPVIDHLTGREVLDSRGNPTVEVCVFVVHLGEVIPSGCCSAPSGLSISTTEAKDCRDNNLSRYLGRGVTLAIRHLQELLTPALKGLELKDLSLLDQKINEVDNTEIREKVGGNACVATSFALAESAALLYDVELFEYLSQQFYPVDQLPPKFRIPTPIFNVLNGAKHGGSDLKIQSVFVIPRDDIPFPERLRMGAEVYHTLGNILTREFGPSSRNVGDEGGYAPPLKTVDQALTILEKAVHVAGYQVGRDVRFGFDASASDFFVAQTRQYEVEPGVLKPADDLVEYWKALLAKHPNVIFVEDPFEEKDYDSWAKLTAAVGETVEIAGDNLYSSNAKNIQRGIEAKWTTSVVLHVNQIGTLTDAMNAAKAAREAGQKLVVSCRSGETCNSLIADLAVAIGSDWIKVGSTARGERVQKLTRLLQIYEYLRDRDRLLQ